MSLIITDEIIMQTNLTAEELRIEIAVLLYQKQKFSLGQASKFANSNKIEFQKTLASRQIPINYDVTELRKDLKTLENLNLKWLL